MTRARAIRLARLGVILPALLGGIAAPAQAQTPPATGTISGYAVDSVHAAALSNAFVALVGTPFGAPTDSTGRFVIDSVPAGVYQAVLLHELLDLLHYTVRTGDLRVTAGDTLEIVIGTPSPETVVARQCGRAPNQEDPAAIIGTVRDLNGKPPADAIVLLTWEQIIVGVESGVRTRAQSRAATAMADGTFRICGLPGDLVGDVRAATESDTSAMIPVQIPSVILTLVELTLPGNDVELVIDSPLVVLDSASAGQIETQQAWRGRSVIAGRVTGRRGQPVIGARVALNGAFGSATTDSSGAFSLAEQPSGSQTLSVRRVGYEPREIAVTLRPTEPLRVSVVLDDFVPLLAEVIVRATRDLALERVGFAARARVGSGYYVWPHEIERRSVSRVSDYLQSAPMLRVSGSGSGRWVTGRLRGTERGCVTYAIDGQRWTGPPPDDYLNPDEVGAIEVYARNLTPGLFLGSVNCELVVIWTKAKLGIR